MTDPTRAATPEPPPAPAEGDVWAELIRDAEAAGMVDLAEMFRARRAFGIEKYGVPLQRGNGRDHVVDLQQELLDYGGEEGAAYLATLMRNMGYVATAVGAR